MIWLLIFLGAFRVGAPTSGTYNESCRDKYAGGKSPYLKRLVKPDDWGVAHRTLPFGTKVEITNPRTGKVAKNAVVIDRGPFGRYKNPKKKTGWYNGIKYYRKFLKAKKAIPNDGWSGCLDMTPDLIKALDHNGKEPVDFKVTQWPGQRSKRKKKPNT
jgi:hypothetical protein